MSRSRARAGGLCKISSDGVPQPDQFINRAILDRSISITDNALSTRQSPLNGIKLLRGESHVSVASNSRTAHDGAVRGGGKQQTPLGRGLICLLLAA